jgi:putative pyruvate formate lyase activating enzyme
VKDYPGVAVKSIREMVRQVGHTLEEDRGIASRGMIIRHLILPGKISNSIEVLNLIKMHISTSVPLSLMSQYTPVSPVKDDPFLGRRITHEEYERVVNTALDMGFETIFTQEVDERTLSPDFEKDLPFNWSQI